MKTKDFGLRLWNARKRKGMTQDELVAAIGGMISKNALSRYERNEMMPRYPVLVALARVLEVQLEYFFRPSTVSITEKDFRLKEDLPAKERDRIPLAATEVLERILETEQLLSLEPRFVNPLQALPAIATASEAEQAAQQLRESWNLGQHGLVDTYGMLGRHGIRVIELEAHEVFDGMKGMVNGHIPVIVVNALMPADRKRFTVLHELAHLLLRFDPSLEADKAERLCNRFSSALLMPAELLKGLLGGPREELSLQELIHIKNLHGTSLQMLVYRAVQLGYIRQPVVDRFKTFIQANIREEGLGRYEGSERVTYLEALVLRAYHSRRITRSKAAELLNLEEKNLPVFFDVAW